jgi:chemotaxis signal transduction protein
MSSAGASASGRAFELKRDFDRAFAEPARVARTGNVDLIGLRVGGKPYAIRLDEIAGLHADKKVTRVPGGAQALRGVAGFRGALMPVYDLRIMLGHPGTETPRWLVLAAAAPLALAFDGFQGQLRVAREEILPQQAGADTYAREIVRSKDFLGPVMHLPSVIEAIRALRA